VDNWITKSPYGSCRSFPTMQKEGHGT
jgi:hypothetical protein